jgi:energy-coupling factor transport system permease protein
VSAAAVSDVAGPATPRPRRAGLSAVLLRQLPGDNPVRRLWAGTKLSCTLAVSVITTVHPSWGELIGATALLVVATVATRVSPFALPRVPYWFWAVIALGAVFGWLGGDPAAYTRLTLLGLVLMVVSLLLIWTTPFDELAPAVAVLGAPLRRLGLPVGEWATTIGLTARSLPLILDEVRVLLAARRLRPRRRRRGLGYLAEDTIDLLTAVMTSSIRRAAEMGEAIAARGGVPTTLRARAIVRWTDVLALLTSAVATGLPWILGY